MANSKFSDLIKCYSRDYIIDYPIENQTLHLAFEYYEPDTIIKSDTIYFNVWLNLYNKRKDMIRNEQLHISTGLNPFKTVLIARKCFIALEEKVLETYQSKYNVVIYCHWVDNRRRDAYYRVLSKRGYQYGRVPFESNKVILKKFKCKNN